MELKKKVLDNGLTLLGEVNEYNKSAALGFFVKTGSRDETVKEAGISHFLEHMMFKGTAKRSTLDITYSMGNIGAQSNAYTGDDATVFYAAVVPKYLPTIQEILCDMLRPSLDAHEFDMEKKVVLEEIALYQDRPQFYFFEHATTDYFGGHPAGNSVLGSTESVSAISRDMMVDYFNRRYAPNNMILVCTGNFNWDEFVFDAEKYCGSWKTVEAKRELRPYLPPKDLERVYHKKDLPQAHLLFMTGGAAVNDPERFPISVLSMIIGDGTGSKLYWDLVDEGLVESAWCDSEEKDDTGTFYAYASMDPEKLDEVCAIMQNVITKPMDFSDDELHQAKTKLAARVVLGTESPMSRLSSLGTSYLARKEVLSPEETAKKIKAVTRADIEDAITKFGFGDWSKFVLLPE